MKHQAVRQRRRVVATVVALAVAGGCRQRRVDTPQATSAPVRVGASASIPLAPADRHAPPVAPVPPPVASQPVAVVGESPWRFSAVLDGSVRSVAFGERSRAAVLADAPYVFDGTTWTRRELPPTLRAGEGVTERLEIFFGRDNQPRLMGERVDTSGRSTPVYLRYVASGWRREPSELGPLAGGKGSLYGVLGFADPEVVCAVDESCLVKRVTGWARTPADPAPRRMFLTSVGVYKQADGALQRLVGTSWVHESALAFEPTGLCLQNLRDAARMWVAGSTPPALWSRPASGDTFVPVDAPVAATDVYCTESGQVWLGGDDGVAWYDGARWARVDGDFGRVSLVTGRPPGEVWVGSERGLFVGRPRADEDSSKR